MKTGFTMKLLLVAIGIATASADGHCEQMPAACGQCDNLAKCYLEAYAIMSCGGKDQVQKGDPKMTCEQKKNFVPAYMANADGTQYGGFKGDYAAGLGPDPDLRRRLSEAPGGPDGEKADGKGPRGPGGEEYTFKSACEGLIGVPYAEDCVEWDMDWDPTTTADILKLPVLNRDTDVTAMDGDGKQCNYNDYLDNECYKFTDCFMEAAPTSQTRNPFCPERNPAFYGFPTWEDFEKYESMAGGDGPDGEKECLEEKYAPNAEGLTSTGELMLVADTSADDFPAECKKSYWSGDVDPVKVPSFCCNPEVTGAVAFFDFETNFADNTCATMNPFDMLAQPKIASGCAADGTQFYGEKCGGSQFTDIGYCDRAVGGCTRDLYEGSDMEGIAFLAAADADPNSCTKASCEAPEAGGVWSRIDDQTYGTCGATTFDEATGIDERDLCKCFTYVESAGPGCYVAAVPDPRLLVLVNFKGCVDEDGEVKMPPRRQMCVDPDDKKSKEFADYDDEYTCKSFGGEWVTLEGKDKEGGDKGMDKDDIKKLVGDMVDKKLEDFEEKMIKKLAKILEAAGVEVEEEDPCKGKKASKCKESSKCSWDKKKEKCRLNKKKNKKD